MSPLGPGVRRAATLALLGVSLARPGAGQEGGFEMPPMPVLFTPAISAEMRGTVELSGTVSSRRSSVVASEVAGLVVELTARQGDRVRRGASLVRLRAESAKLRLRAAEGELKEARARLALAAGARDRARRLATELVISQEQLDQRLGEYEASEGRAEQLEAEVARLQDELARTVVRAPFGGVVAEERVAVGEWIAAGGAVALMVDTTDLELELEVPENLFAGLVAGEPVRVVVDALDGHEVSGRVRAVVPSAKAQARTFPVLIDVPNPEGRIGVGMLGRARLAVGEPRPAVLVPKDSVVSQPRGIVVFVLDEANQAQPVAVETGGAKADWIEVSGELAAGDRVITLGNERLMPGQAVDPTLKEYEKP